MLRTVIALLAALSIGLLMPDESRAQSRQDSVYFQINKSLQVFGDVFRQISHNFVDEIDPEEFVSVGLNEMLNYLDPYTVYYDDEEDDEIDMITRGIYGGLGMTISTIDGKITIVGLTEGYAAERAGMRIGDVLYAIDSSLVIGAGSSELRSYTRGEPGTKVVLRILREGRPDTLRFTMEREKIRLANVTYAGMLEGNIAFIKLERFSRSAASEFREALEELRSTRPLAGLIIDLRGNPGGLLESAVSIAELFVPTGSTIVSTRGRSVHSKKDYVSRNMPLAPDLPLAVLIDDGSASASEILAGAIQDLDRGIVVGERSFGKGLVQTISHLPYGATLKMTTAKYYTPSGRCIQRVNYTSKRSGIVLEPEDTARVFTTVGGRTVRESNGILPDTIVRKTELSEFVYALQRQHMVFRFATWYAARLDSLPATFTVDSTVLQSLNDYLRKNEFTHMGSALEKVRSLEELVLSDAHYEHLAGEVQHLKEELLQMQSNEVHAHKSEFSALLDEEIRARFYSKSVLIRHTLGDDEQVQTARALLKNSTEYHAIIHPAHNSDE